MIVRDRQMEELENITAAAQQLENAAYSLAGLVDPEVVSELILLSAKAQRLKYRFANIQ